MNSIELCLLTLHQPAILIMWSPKSGDQIWRKSFSDPLMSLSRDPFHPKRLIRKQGQLVPHTYLQAIVFHNSILYKQIFIIFVLLSARSVSEIKVYSYIVVSGGNFIQYITDFSTSLQPSDGNKLYLTNSSTGTHLTLLSEFSIHGSRIKYKLCSQQISS